MIKSQICDAFTFYYIIRDIDLSQDLTSIDSFDYVAIYNPIDKRIKLIIIPLKHIYDNHKYNLCIYLNSLKPVESITKTIFNLI